MVSDEQSVTYCVTSAVTKSNIASCTWHVGACTLNFSCSGTGAARITVKVNERVFIGAHFTRVGVTAEKSRIAPPGVVAPKIIWPMMGLVAVTLV